MTTQRCGRCGRLLLAIDGGRLHCLPCRSQIEQERRSLLRCKHPGCHEPAVQSKDGTLRTVCAEHLALARTDLEATPLARRVEDDNRRLAIANLLRIEKELRD